MTPWRRGCAPPSGRTRRDQAAGMSASWPPSSGTSESAPTSGCAPARTSRTGRAAPGRGWRVAGAGGRAGRYQIDGEIARGGIGVVLKGRDTDLGREVAIKPLRAEYSASPAMVRRLVEEAQI